MLASAAIVWITTQLEIDPARVMLGRGWTIAATADASFQPLFVYPDFQSGLTARGGFRLRHPLRHNVALSLTGRAGGTYVDDWRPIFEAVADMSWREAIDVHAGVRHDDRLRREAALADFRDPTGRLFAGVTALPLRKGPIAAGAAIDYERAMPGAGRLPSGVSVTAVARLRFPS